jgi:predicted dinucleotide-binding enzyme
MIAEHFKLATVVKAFNSIRMSDLLQHSFPSQAQKLALPLAGDDVDAKKIVLQLYASIGFDGVDIGGLAEGWRFERDQPTYCQLLHKEQLLEQLLQTERHH